jgi:branched-chain amino acid transport system permease protein
MNYLFHILIYLGIYATLAMSLNIVVGYCGLLTLAHAGFFAVGAYAYAVGTLCFAMNAVTAFLLALLAGGLFSFLISLPTWRLRGDYFVLASLAVQVLIYTIAYNWHSSGTKLGTLANMTNGPFGIAGIPRPELFGIQLQSLGSMAFFSLSIAALAFGLSWLLLGSPWGRVLKCMRDDELATRNLGKEVQYLKVQALFIASAMAIKALYVSSCLS